MMTHSGRLPKLANDSPRLLLTRKAFSDENADGGEANTASSQMILTPKSYNQNSQSYERKNMKTQGENPQLLDPISSFSSGLPRWGQVSCPVLFRNYYRENTSRFSVPKNQLSFSPICSQRMPTGSKSPILTAMNVEKGFLESDNILTEEIQKLRAEAECLEKLCKTRSEKIQECKRRIEDTWSLAKEEAAKSKAAKEVIKVLTLKIHTVSQKLYAGKDLKDPVNGHLSQVTSIPMDSPTLKGVNTMFIGTHTPPEVRPLEDRKLDSLCSSPIMFSNTVKSVSDGEIYHCGPTLAEESIVERTDSGQNGFKTMKLEWVEKYEPGVYITFTTLPSGLKGLKRVRFSRKKFTEKEAQRWWEENEVAVYQKYELEGYMSSNLDDVRG